MANRCATAELTRVIDTPSHHANGQEDVAAFGSGAERYRTRGTRSRRLSFDKRKTTQLFRQYQEADDRASRDELITMHLSLVRYLASKYRSRGEPIDDLIQVGTIGLIKAVDRFDASRGLQFTTYATPTILGEIKRHFRDKGWAMKVPRRLQELSYAVNRAMDELTRENQCSPSIDELARHLKVDSEEVLLAMESSSVYNLTSIDSFCGTGDSDSFSLLDVLGATDPLMAIVDDRTTLSAALKDVSPMEQRAVYMRFYEGASQTDIARELGVSQMQISRMLRKTLKALRESIGGI